MDGQTPKIEENAPASSPHPDSLGIASLVFGLISVSCCCFAEIAALSGGVSILLACISRAKLGRLSGFAVAGLVCGIFGAIVGVTALVISAVLFLSPELSETLERLIFG